jgi:hypothetical protein
LHVLLYEPDLLFSSQIESAARRHGYEVKLITAFPELVEALKDPSFQIVIVNLDSIHDIDALGALTGSPGRQLIGYYSHVESKIAESAKRVGFDTVLPRRAFALKLNDLLGAGN